MSVRVSGRLRLRPGSGASGNQAGYTLVELVMVCTLMLTLAAVVVPVATFSVKRVKEMELRAALRTMRDAIDEYKRYSDAGLIPLELGAEGYPTDLDVLIEPVDVVGTVDRHVRFLRKIPVDPMTGEAEWGKRSHRDEPDSSIWGGESLFDVYSESEGVGMNGVPYAEW